VQILAAEPIDTGDFYARFDGHNAQDLMTLHQALRGYPARPALFLAGDSSLDNKHWLFPGNQSALQLQSDARGFFTAPALNGYECVMRPARMVMDVAYWMNALLVHHQVGVFAINAAVEATTLSSRSGGVECCIVPSCGGLYPQDQFIRDHIQPEDYLVVSVGGNDVAMLPSIFTVVSLLSLMLTPFCLLRAMLWVHPGVLYFSFLFRRMVCRYLLLLTAKSRPRKIGACFIYNPDERNCQASWATGALCLLCYCCWPGLLQRRMRLAFELGTCMVRLPGTEIVPIHLAEVLDGKDTRDYHERVEPSVQGGRKLAQLILRKLALVP